MGFGRKAWTTMFILPVLGLTMGVQAGSVGYQFRMAGNKNVPTFRLTNQSTSADITGFTMTIGDTKYNFDFHRPYPSLTKINPTIGGTFGSPDLVHDNVRSNTLSVSYTDFQPGEFHRFKIDIDPDNANKRVDYKKILFDLGGNSGADNAKLTVNFSNGKSLSGYLPDFAGPNLGKKYAYTQSLDLPVIDHGGYGPPPPHTVPLPAGIWAGLSALGVMGTWRSANRILRTL